MTQSDNMPEDYQSPSDPPVRSTECSAAASENKELRIMLAIAHAGLALYSDDGELQDNRVQPFIDFKRDSVSEIERKLRERSYASAKARKQQNDEAHPRRPAATVERKETDEK